MMNIEEIKGIGEKTKVLFNKLGIFTTDDIIKYFPRDYDIYKEEISIDEIDNEKVVSIKGVFRTKPVLIARGGKKIVSGVLVDENMKKIQVVWYNMPFIAKSIMLDTQLILRGALKRDKKGNIEKLIQPDIYSIDKYKEKLNFMQPIYGLTKGVTNNLVVKCVKKAMSVTTDLLDYEYLPSEIIEKLNIMNEYEAICKVHFPKNLEEAYAARKRLAFDEFFLFILSLRSLKTKDVSIENNYRIETDSKTREFINKLPYKLTNAQKKVIEEIDSDMSSEVIMNRLVQGDVGSGKTIVALIALMNTVFAGYQGAIMAPTEVLAKQHFEGFKELFEKYDISINVVLLTGSMSQKEKKDVYKKIESGEADIIVGTHALIVDKVNYHELGLVITDEQHRFGVMQRKSLGEKGNYPHILVMSATPIPRTLAIILYGDLSISVINELPSDRLKIKNCVVTSDYRPKAYKFIENQINEGRQAYVVCPMVEESENIESCDVVSYTSILREELPNLTIEYLHGKMKAKDKNDIMDRFASGLIDVLVSTTVIEVGVNVPNATVMMIENAERFGLATLHQLRGRVGRGNYQSYCILVSSSKKKDKIDRLEIMNKSNDGFFIASEDLKMRGPGDMLGIRQSGDLVFKIGDIFGDADMLKEAYDLANFIENNEECISQKSRDILEKKIRDYTNIVFNSVNL